MSLPPTPAFTSLPLHPEPPTGMRPLWVVVLASFWIATVCNVALWRALARLPDLSGTQAVTVSVALALVIGGRFERAELVPAERSRIAGLVAFVRVAERGSWCR